MNVFKHLCLRYSRNSNQKGGILLAGFLAPFLSVISSHQPSLARDTQPAGSTYPQHFKDSGNDPEFQDSEAYREPEFESPTSGAFFEWNTGFGQAFSTKGDDPGQGYSMNLVFGAKRSTSIWESIEPSLVIFHRSLTTSSRSLRVPLGLGIQVVYDYRINELIRGNLGILVGLGKGRYEETRNEHTFTAAPSAPVQTARLNTSLRYDISDSTDFQIGLNINHLQVALDSLRTKQTTIDYRHTEHVNLHEVQVGLKYKFLD